MKQRTKRIKYSNTLIMTEAQIKSHLLKEGVVFDSIMNVIRTLIMSGADTGTAELGGALAYVPLLAKNVFGLYRKNKKLLDIYPQSDADLQNKAQINALIKLRRDMSKNITQMVQATVFLFPGMAADDIVALIVGQAPETVASTISELMYQLFQKYPEFKKIARMLTAPAGGPIIFDALDNIKKLNWMIDTKTLPPEDSAQPALPGPPPEIPAADDTQGVPMPKQQRRRIPPPPEIPAADDTQFIPIPTNRKPDLNEIKKVILKHKIRNILRGK